MKTTKLNDNEIEVTKTENKEVKHVFSYEYLINQRKTIQEQKDRDNAQRDAELVEIDNLLGECAKLNVKEKEEKTIKPE